MIQQINFNPEFFETNFIKQFTFNIDMLNYRLNRMWEIDTMQKDNQQEYLMVFDATIVLFRAMFLENGSHKKNYTFQNFFRLTGRDEVAGQIDSFLNSPFTSYCDKSIRDVLKFIADKFVCHVDCVEDTDLGLCNVWMGNLSNPYFANNFRHIMDSIEKIINSEIH